MPSRYLQTSAKLLESTRTIQLYITRGQNQAVGGGEATNFRGECETQGGSRTAEDGE